MEKDYKAPKHNEKKGPKKIENTRAQKENQEMKEESCVRNGKR